MSIVGELFSRSPFTPLQAHMEKVALCVGKLEELYRAFMEQDEKKLETLVEEVSDLEHSADLTKNDIRSNLPRGLFLAINRADLLQILSLQDALADTAEDIAVLTTFKRLEPLNGLKKELRAFLSKNIEAVSQVHKLIYELDKLLQSSFGGNESKKVRQMVHDVAYLEHEADVLQRTILKKIYNMEDTLDYASFSLWINIIQAIAALSNISEKLGYKIASLVETN